MFERVRARFLHYSAAAPRRAALLRYALTLGVIAAIVLIIPRTPLDGPIGGLIVAAVLLVTCWYGGPGPAAFTPLLIFFLTRLTSDQVKPLTPTGKEVTTIILMMVLTASVGLAGQYRRRFVEATESFIARIREQSSALSLARIVFRDLDGRITVWTEGAEQLFGWTIAEATGRNLYELLRTEAPRPLVEIRRELIHTGQWQGEVVHHHKNGMPLNILTHCILYEGAEGRGGQAAEVHTDVTRQRQIEAEVRESDRRKDLFIATLAHELRNPLAPVRSGLDLLQMTCGNSDDEKTVLDVMGRQLNHMVRLIDDLLDISRINTGKVTLCRQLVALDDIVQDAVAAALPQLESAGHQFSISLPERPVYLNADPLRLAQVLTNLLNNAAKFTPAGGMISMTALAHGRQLELEVRDNGIGIGPSELPYIFDTFNQAENLHLRSHGGLGLGLSIVKALAEMHGGSVEAHSDGPGTGSRFVLRVPCHSSPLPPPSSNGHSSAPENQPGFQRVLVVDDNRDAARLLAATLRRSGCDCLEAFDGPSALQAAETFDPGAFILDLGMPGMSGYDVARSLRMNPRFAHALLIAVTGWDKEEDRRQSNAAGFDHHLAKPVDVQLLKGLLASKPRSADTFTTSAEERRDRQPILDPELPSNTAQA